MGAGRWRGGAGGLRRGGYRFGAVDASLRVEGFLGPNHAANNDCCGNDYGYSGVTALGEVGWSLFDGRARLYAGAGPAWITLLAQQAGHLAGQSGGSPAFEVGAQICLWGRGGRGFFLELQGLLWTGLGADGGADHFGHSSSELALTALLEFRL